MSSHEKIVSVFLIIIIWLLTLALVLTVIGKLKWLMQMFRN
ncbi:MAG: hypothetical protein ACO1OO_13075 [Flavisolibacter sp.]